MPVCGIPQNHVVSLQYRTQQVHITHKEETLERLPNSLPVKHHIGQWLSKKKTIMYADNTLILNMGINPEQKQQQLQTQASNTVLWINQSTYQNKTNYILLPTK